MCIGLGSGVLTHLMESMFWLRRFVIPSCKCACASVIQMLRLWLFPAQQLTGNDTRSFVSPPTAARRLYYSAC